MPAEAEGTSPAAAKAFARHYFAMINFAARTGETAALRELGTPDCVSCDAIASNIEKVYRAGGHIESRGWTLQHVRNLQTTNRRSVLALSVFLEPEVVVNATGNREAHRGRQQPMSMRLAGHNGQFQVARLDLIA